MCNYYSWVFNNNASRINETAVFAGDYKYSFQEIFDLADVIADRLTGLDIHEGEFILASMMPTPEGIALMLACAKLDICCMTLLPGVNDDKLLSFIQAEDVKYAFVEEVFLGALFGLPKSLEALESIYALPHDIYLSDEEKLHIDYNGQFGFAKKWNAFLEVKAISSKPVERPKHPLYICATPDHDNPKGIMYSQASMIEAAKMLVSSQQNMKPGFITHSRIPMFTTAGNSMETMSPFAAGLTLATGQIPMEDGKCIPEEFRKYSPNCFMIAKTSILQAMDNPLMASLDFSNLLSFYSIGEAMSEEEKKIIGEFFMSRNATTTIRNAYGLSESNCILTSEAPSTEISSTVGRPVPNVDLHIINPETLENVENGCPGEIIYSAPCMMDGYFKDEEATAKRLFKWNDGKTYDHTGDLGSLDANGNLHILGRVEERYKSEDGRIHYFFEIRKDINACAYFDTAYIVANEENVYIHYLKGNEDPTEIIKLREKLIADGVYRKAHFFLKQWDTFPTSGGRVRSYVLNVGLEDSISMDDFQGMRK